MSVLLLTMGPQLGITASIPAVAVGDAGTIAFRAVGAVGQVKWSLVSDTLPAEWDNALTSNGDEATLSTAEALQWGNFTVTVRAVDDQRVPVVRTFLVRVGVTPMSISGMIPDWHISTPVSGSLLIDGGVPPYSSLLTASGALPVGVTASIAGAHIVFSGTPTSVDAGTVTLQVSDTQGALARGQFAWAVGYMPITITGALPPMVSGVPYTATLTVSGGTGTYVNVLMTGAPAGITAGIAGGMITLSGTPTGAGSGSLNITVTDDSSATGSDSFPWTVTSASLSATIISMSPTGYWKLNDTAPSTVVLDHSGNGHHGVSTGTVTPGASPPFSGNAGGITFASNAGAILLPTLHRSGNDPFTAVAFFLNRTGSSGTRALLSADGGPRTFFTGTNVSSGNFNARVLTSGASESLSSVLAPTSAPIPAMICLVFDPSLAAVDGRYKLYVNGVETARTTTALTNDMIDIPLAIGQQSNSSTSQRFDGVIADCAFFNGRALSPAEVSAIWAARATL